MVPTEWKEQFKFVLMVTGVLSVIHLALGTADLLILYAVNLDILPTVKIVIKGYTSLMYAHW